MFEPNEKFNVRVVKNIKGRSVVVIDNFYKNPDEIRELSLSQELVENEDLTSGFPGKRCFVETPEVKENLYDIYHQLCTNTEHIWDNPDSLPGKQRPFNSEAFDWYWDNIGFLANVLDDSTIIKSRSGIVPHQDYYESDNPDKSRSQFASVIYLNPPHECAGGTNLYSYKDQISLYEWPFAEKLGIDAPDNIEDYPTDEDKFRYIKFKLDEGDPWKIECEVEMVYNRMVLYQADVLHGQNVDLGMFTNYDRINQVMFM